VSFARVVCHPVKLGASVRTEREDAVGVAVAVQATNPLKLPSLRPIRALRAIAWMNEENGLRGARGTSRGSNLQLPRS